MSEQKPEGSHGLTRRQLLRYGLAASAGGVAPWIAGCGSSGGGSGGNSWTAMSWDGKTEVQDWEHLIGAFFRKNDPNMKWKLQYGLTWDGYWTKLQTVIAGGASPDMCWMHDTRVGLYASKGLITPLDSYLSKSPPSGWPEKFYESQVKSFQYQHKQYGFPYDWATGGLFVNLDLLEEAGVDVPTEDWTYDDLLNAAVKLTKRKGDKVETWGVLLPTDSFNAYFVARCFGGEYVSGTPLKPHFTDPGTVQAFQYIYDLMWKHKVMPDPNVFKALGPNAGGDTLFAAGKLAIFYTLNDGAAPLHDELTKHFRWTVAPTPKGVAGRYQFEGGSSWAIPKGSKHPDVSYQLMKYVLDRPDSSNFMARSQSRFVSRQDLWRDGLPKAIGIQPAQFKHVFYDLGKRDGVRPLYYPEYAQWDTSVYGKLTDGLWVNQQHDVKQVMGQIQSATQPLLTS